MGMGCSILKPQSRPSSGEGPLEPVEGHYYPRTAKSKDKYQFRRTQYW